LHGDRFRRESGQLALLDALVFFSIAILVSGVMISYVGFSSGDAMTGACEPPRDVAEVLSALMAASIGSAVESQTGLEVSGHESIAECLSAELYALSLNVERQMFDGLNAAIGEAVEPLSGPLFDWLIIVVDPDGSSDEPCLVIPESHALSSLAYAASTELPCSDGVLYTVILILEPATPSELVQV